MIRRGGVQDVPFLRDLVRHASSWRMSAPPDGDDPPVSRYVDGWGRPGDRAVIALQDFQRVGAAWYRLFTAARPGYGFVDEETPELSIAVVPSRRGRGLGRELLEGLLAEARREGFPALSLSVERDNPSIKLYERHGFKTVREDADTVIMRAGLA